MSKTRNGPTSLLLVSFLSFIIIGLPGGALGVAWLHIQQTFGLGLESLGFLLTASTIGRLVTAFTSGRWVASFGISRVLVGGGVLGVVGVLGFILAPAWPLLLLSEFVRGLGSGLIDAGVNTFVAPRYSASRMNWLHACFGIGLTIGPALVTALVIEQGQSWRTVYLALLVCNAVLTVIFAATRRRWKQAAAPQQQDTAETNVGILDTLRLLMMWLSLALFFFYGGAEIGTGQLLNSLFVEARGIDAKTAAFWISFYWGIFSVGRMLIGVVVDRIGPRALLRVSLIGTVLGAAMIWWNPVVEVSYAGLTLMGLALAPVFPTLIAVTPDRVGVAHTPNAIGFQIGFAGLGAAVLVGLAGALAEAAGKELIAPFLLGVAVVTLILHEIIMLREIGQRAVVVAKN